MQAIGNFCISGQPQNSKNQEISKVGKNYHGYYSVPEQTVPEQRPLSAETRRAH